MPQRFQIARLRIHATQERIQANRVEIELCRQAIQAKRIRLALEAETPTERRIRELEASNAMLKAIAAEQEQEPDEPERTTLPKQTSPTDEVEGYFRTYHRKLGQARWDNHYRIYEEVRDAFTGKGN